MTSHRTGLAAEALCRWALRLKGYRIVAQRYRSKLGEIDIVAVRGRRLALVEVKARDKWQVAAAAIAPRQRERLARAAADFIARNPRFAAHDIGFDAMLVGRRSWPRHIVNAWEDGCPFVR